MPYTTCTVPDGGRISIQNGKLTVPDQPIIPFIRGDGTGPDIWAASERVFDAAIGEGVRRTAPDFLDGGVCGRGREDEV